MSYYLLNHQKMAITGAITAFICSAYLLTIVLDHPFSGEIAVANGAFKQGELAIYRASPTPRDVRADDLASMRARDVVGVWTSDAFGTMVFRRVGDEILGALRLARGTVVARTSGGSCAGRGARRPRVGCPGTSARSSGG